jgi:ribose transport system ATP-binding protein
MTAATATPLLQLTGIEKHFGATHALRGVDFTVEPGQIHGLAGANGAGKSTLMKIINGVYQSDAGSITLSGKPVTFRSPRQAQKAGIGMVFQEFSLVSSLTVSQNVHLSEPLTAGRRLKLREERRNTRALMERLGVDIDPSATVAEIPVPHRQLTEIAKALAGNRRVLVLDEPTASLTQREAAQLLLVLRRLADEGLGIVFISHHLSEVLEICDVITVMRDGAIARHDAASAFTLDSLVTAMLGGTAVERTAPAPPAHPDAEVLMAVRGISSGDRVSDISFDIRRGDVIGVAGLLGSGRTELLECLAGLRRVGKGRVDRAAARTALVPEDRRTQGFVQQFSIKENIALPVAATAVQRPVRAAQRGRRARPNDDRRPERQGVRRRRRRQRPVGRQSAEGRLGQEPGAARGRAAARRPDIWDRHPYGRRHHAPGPSVRGGRRRGTVGQL